MRDNDWEFWCTTCQSWFIMGQGSAGICAGTSDWGGDAAIWRASQADAEQELANWPGPLLDIEDDGPWEDGEDVEITGPSS